MQYDASDRYQDLAALLSALEAHQHAPKDRAYDFVAAGGTYTLDMDYFGKAADPSQQQDGPRHVLRRGR